MYRRVWVAAALLITCSFAALYIAVQQALRLGANDPQAAIAQDVADAIGSNRKSELSDHIDVRYSMAPFVVVYDKNGTAVSGTGYLDGELPAIPFGVLQHTPTSGAHTVTWAPLPGIRIAAVSVQAHGYYVVSGRSLATTEDHIKQVGQFMLCAWLLTMAGIGTAYVIVSQPSRQ
jgi:hypothetical protein